ncbi:MAG: 4Fe-4S binding protein [Planctomycetes bacterium]|nr:4Fe-4S binding protein [Planctomycetota bacterium]
MKSVSVPLPIITQPQASARECASHPHTPIRASRMSAKRFIVLFVVQAFILLHIAHWLAVGTTLAPIEPSESMETLKHGTVTVGAIFFLIALASTAIFGRWFCGWGCHVLLLQDGCAVLLKRLGLRPREFRSRLLRWIPLALALYMFAWPVVYRFGIAPFVQPDLQPMHLSWKLTLDDYWATFPGWMVGIPFLLVCGGLTVWFLGNKGYCTYACPYGGFFAPVDELAVGRIRVNDACEGCGHCTAVCTSNVRVHEEVALHKMVVDPGCMKCMDCVSVCPNNALSFGFGKPALAVASETRAARSWDLTWTGEWALLAAALLGFYAVYFPFSDGVGKVTLPLLFASGLAACFAFMAWKSAQVVRRVPTGFHRVNLVRQGRIAPAGVAWIALTVLVGAGLCANLATNVSALMAFRNDSKVQVPEALVFSTDRSPVDPRTVVFAESAVGWYRRTLPVSLGGIALLQPAQDQVLLRMVFLHGVLAQWGDAEALIQRRLAESDNEVFTLLLARVWRSAGRTDRAVEWLTEQSRRHPEWMGIPEELIGMLVRDGRNAEAILAAREASSRADAPTILNNRLAALLIRQGSAEEVEEGLRIARATQQREPDNASLLGVVGLGEIRLGRVELAMPLIERALDLSPNDPALHEIMAEACEMRGEVERAQHHRDRSGELRFGVRAE